MKQRIADYLNESLTIKTKVLENSLEIIEKTAKAIVHTFNQGGKLIIFGNGGSAADAQHMTAELVGRFVMDRKPLPAIALTTNACTITALSNDYSYENIFVRQLTALLKDFDMVFGITTSGASENVVKAIEFAKEKKNKTIALTGLPGRPARDIADYSIVVPSKVTSIVQESHISIIHVICKLIEEELFSNV